MYRYAACNSGVYPPNYTKYRLLLLSDSKIDFLKFISEGLFCGRLEAFFVVADVFLAWVVWRSLSVDVFYLLYERSGECPKD